MRFVPLSIIIWLTLFLWLIKWVPVAKKIRKKRSFQPTEVRVIGAERRPGPQGRTHIQRWQPSRLLLLWLQARRYMLNILFSARLWHLRPVARLRLFWLRKEVSRLFCRLFPKAKEVGGFHCRETRISRSNNCSLMVYHLCRQMLSRHASFSAF